VSSGNSRFQKVQQTQYQEDPLAERQIGGRWQDKKDVRIKEGFSPLVNGVREYWVCDRSRNEQKDKDKGAKQLWSMESGVNLSTS